MCTICQLGGSIVKLWQSSRQPPVVQPSVLTAYEVEVSETMLLLAKINPLDVFPWTGVTVKAAYCSVGVQLVCPEVSMFFSLLGKRQRHLIRAFEILK